MMEAANTSETLVNFYQTTRRNNTEEFPFYSLPWESEISPTYSQADQSKTDSMSGVGYVARIR
jgi:hypothetical protein